MGTNAIFEGLHQHAGTAGQTRPARIGTGSRGARLVRWGRSLALGLLAPALASWVLVPAAKPDGAALAAASWFRAVHAQAQGAYARGLRLANDLRLFYQVSQLNGMQLDSPAASAIVASPAGQVTQCKLSEVARPLHRPPRTRS